MLNDSDSPRPEADTPTDQVSESEAGTQEEDAFLSFLFRDKQRPRPKPDPETRQEAQQEPNPAKRKLLLTIVLLLAALLVIGVTCLGIFRGVYLSGKLLRLFRYPGDETVFSFDAHSANSYLSFHRGLAVASPGGLLYLDANGQQKAMIQNQMNPPVVLQNDVTAISYGVGGSTISITNWRNGQQPELTVSGSIIDADLSDDSCICYSSVQAGYKTVLAVNDENGRELYRWYSSTRFFGPCAVSKGGERLCAIAFGLDGNSFDATAVLFATDQEKPLAELNLGGDMVYELAFIGYDRVCAVSETAMHFFNGDGRRYSNYDYNGGELLAYDLGGDGFAAIALDTNQVGSRFRIATVDSNGSELASLSLDEEIRDINANGSYLAVLTSQRLLVYDSKLHLCLSRDSIGYATNVCVQTDGAAVLIEGSTARRVS